jgi:hypothetical protein
MQSRVQVCAYWSSENAAIQIFLGDSNATLSAKKIRAPRIDDGEGQPILTGADEKVPPGKLWSIRHCPPFPTDSQF